MTDQLPAVVAGYELTTTPLKGRSPRSDWLVAAATPTPPVEAPDFVDRMRQFFTEMDAEIDKRFDDPIATSQALARMEALLADVRYIRDRLRDLTATSMTEHQVRRLTVEGVSTVEASSTVNRANWMHADLIREFLLADDLPELLVNPVTGETVSLDYIANRVALLYGPSTAPRMTPLREAGIDPDEHCEMEHDEDGKVVRTPTIRMVDNRVRGRS